MCLAQHPFPKLEHREPCLTNGPILVIGLALSSMVLSSQEDAAGTLGRCRIQS
jgi:hypothetical protein